MLERSHCCTVCVCHHTAASVGGLLKLTGACAVSQLPPPACGLQNLCGSICEQMVPHVWMRCRNISESSPKIILPGHPHKSVIGGHSTSPPTGVKREYVIAMFGLYWMWVTSTGWYCLRMHMCSSCSDCSLVLSTF